VQEQKDQRLMAANQESDRLNRGRKTNLWTILFPSRRHWVGIQWYSCNLCLLFLLLARWSHMCLTDCPQLALFSCYDH